MTRSAGMPTRSATAVGGRRAVAGDQPDLEPGVGELGDRLGRLGLDRVGDRDDARDRAVDRDPDERPAGAGEALRVGVERRRCRSRARRAGGRCRRGRRRPSTTPLDAPSGAGLERLDRPGTPARRAWPGRRSPPRADARCRVSSDAARSSTLGRVDARRRLDGDDRPAGPRSACRSCRSTTVSMRCGRSSASPPRNRIPASAPRPVPTMIAVGVARPIAHGQATMTTPMNAVSARVSRGSGPNSEPGRERQRRRATRTAGTKTSLIRSASRWIGALRALGLLDEGDDPGEGGVGADARRPER